MIKTDLPINHLHMKNTPSNGGLPEVKTHTAAINLRTTLENTALAHAQANKQPTKFDVAFVGLLSHMSQRITEILKGGHEEKAIPMINKFIAKETPEKLKETVTKAITKANNEKEGWLR